MRPHPQRPARARGGFTLVELAIALALMVLLLAMATPSVHERLQRQRLLSVAQHLAADIAQGRHEALRRHRVLHLVVRPGARWCYALALSADADCRAVAPAPGDGGDASASRPLDPALLRVVRAEDNPGVELQDADPITIGPSQGLPVAGQGTGRVEFRSQQGLQLRVQLSPLGRSALCTPGPSMPGVAPCVNL